ncbi:NAD(P)-binding protein [Aureobasidium pullulans]|uniref:NAD(P)-binding protein n=1 Tax=Aureobasidium pullulans TaxID=5580 RepID=A0A4S8UXG5_AURPU|nr:NAD(P)-binding protein [Aureobasidium pullulans]
MDLGLGLEDTHVLVTGGDGIIGSIIVSAFLSAGANVSSLDITHPQDSQPSVESLSPGKLLNLHADITSTSSLTTAWDFATSAFGTVECCIAAAGVDLSVLPQSGITDMDPSTWNRIFTTNIHGTFLTTKFWLRGLRDHISSSSSSSSANTEIKNPGFIIIGSEAGHFGVETQAAYSASKSAVQYGLLSSLRVEVPKIHARARSNAIAPGAVNTPRFQEETNGAGTRRWWKECEATTGLKKPVEVEQVARSVLFLASERWSGNVHGQCLNVDSGKQGVVVWEYEGDDGGKEEEEKVLMDG